MSKKNYRLAEGLKTLRNQLNTVFPNRSKLSDGWIGDTAHKAGKSDHNPNAAGVVTALDITFDNNPSDGIGVNCQHLADVLTKSDDKRIKYIIWNSRITLPGDITKWKKYTGRNPHDHHLHISVVKEAKLYDSPAAWNLTGLDRSAPNAAPLPRTYTVKPGDTLSAIIKKFNLKMVEFYQLNGFTADSFDADNIRTGDIFKI